MKRYTPNPKDGDRPWQWDCWWRPWVLCISEADDDNLAFVSAAMEQWAIIDEGLAEQQRRESWVQRAMDAVAKPGAPAAHRFLKGPHTWGRQDWSHQPGQDEEAGTPQHHMKSREAFWHPLWGVGREDQPLEEFCVPADAVDEIVLPEPQQLMALARTYSARTSVGCDALHPFRYGMLSDEALRGLVLLWKSMIAQGVTPRVFASILIALLPKDGGDRPIAIFST
jgi:hypothetical protein